MRLLLLSLLLSACAQAAVFPLPPKDSALLGQLVSYKVEKGDYFEAIARDRDLSPLNLIEANPGIDPLLPSPGLLLTLPTAMLLPDAPRQGIVINLAELRLYYFDTANKRVFVFPVGIGRIGLDSPLGQTAVVSKQKDPVWTPTKGTHERLAEQGQSIPDKVPAGPDNPLGKYALRLGFKGGQYLIHGTNLDVGVGMRVSAGCIRLMPDNIEELFQMVPVGTPVRIVNQPVKTALEPDGTLYLEVHQPLTRGGSAPDLLQLSQSQQKWLSANFADEDRVRQALLAKSGLPLAVGQKQQGASVQAP
ncbi:L,D-transpeptidase family protein [Gallaecimonas kandeliae]|uniref:L,D-transpeptidase family protein n=1 Tax=Gallaecimonas kandeliae TaxID=3029055 RepID=UPI002647A056|nr:L,D-transpeptidase family protein [Gallaecimonas kandeliae]WKE66504.1 L,D-transpeptidase family protein [Gallaecimonas kandeliae]